MKAGGRSAGRRIVGIATARYVPASDARMMQRYHAA
jgi:hypothetical protein